MLMKMVNGIPVECSTEEEANIRAEWAANDAKPPPKEVPSLTRLISVLTEKRILEDGDL